MASRLKRRQALQQQQQLQLQPSSSGVAADSGSSSSRLPVGLLVVGAAAGVGYSQRESLGKLYAGSPIEQGVNWVFGKVAGVVKHFTDPNSDKLLPDWPLPNMHPDTPCPPTLVLDLEETLVAADWSQKKGWRIAKRPGVDKFLEELCQHFEIVVFTSNHAGTADAIITSLDPKGCIMWRLFREATHFKDGVHCKDLSKLNRDLRRIVIVDDAPESFAMQPENGISIKPYKIERGVNPLADRSLERLLPFLKALAVEGVEDFRPVLRRYKGLDSDAIADEYEERLKEVKARQAEERTRGLGGLLRSANTGAALGMYGTYRPARGADSAEVIPSSKDLVGDVGEVYAGALSSGPKSGPPPPKEEEAGLLLRMYKQHSKEAEDDYRRKMEKWNEVMQQKMGKA